MSLCLIAKEYLAQECMTFMSKYLKVVETSLNRPRRNQEDDNTEVDTRIDMSKNISRIVIFERAIVFYRIELEDLHRYMLFNCDTIDSYLE